MIGGLTVSTFFTLFLVPSLYTLLAFLKRQAPEEGEDESGGLEEAAHA